jgi:hypothetical protein
MESSPPGRDMFFDLAPGINNGYSEETRSVEVDIDVQVVSVKLVDC